MGSKFSERLAAFCLSFVMLLSCCAPYGFAAETDAEISEITETDSAEAVAEDAQAVETAETDDAEASEDAEISDVAETNGAEAVMESAETSETAEETAVLYAESVGLTDFTSYNYPDKLEILRWSAARNSPKPRISER